MLEERFGGDPFGCRIAALLHVYGAEEPFIRAWISGEDGLPACALLLFGDTVILSRAGQADWEELSAFLHMLPGAERLLCDEETCRALGFPGEAAGPALRLEGTCSPPETPVEWDPSPRELYPVLQAAQGPGFTVPPFEEFYVDLSHRIRHGTALSAAVRREERLVACGLCAALTGQSALLSAVCTLPEERGKGCGGAVVRALARRLREDAPGREIFLLREEQKNENFYARLGFVPCGRWCEARLS